MAASIRRYALPLSQDGESPNSISVIRRIDLAGSPGPGETAAVIAAVERFVAETAPVRSAAPPVNPWQRAALIEGISAKAAFGPTNVPRDPWP